MTASNKYHQGRETLKQIFGTHGENAVAALEPVAPDLARQIYEHAYGDTYARADLNLRDRSLITIAGLTALGYPQQQLASHIRGGLNVGLERSEIVETITHMALYAGFPAAVNAAMTAKDVFAELDTPAQETI
ncbi:MAG: carboxymuconolactone decarboxylase family protein [Pseudomonadota bacterium]